MSPKKERGFLAEQAMKWAVSGFLWMVSAVGIIMLPPVTNFGREMISIPERFAVIEEQIATLTGADRILNQPDGLSYVREPVFWNDRIQAIYFIGSTELGENCKMAEIIPQFTDEQNVTQTGDPMRPLQQLTRRVRKLEFSLQPPARIQPGRTMLQLQLQYECDGATAFELTKPLYYYSLPRNTNNNEGN